jgi:hypothetical protein
LKAARFDDVREDLKLAIEGRGLVIDHESHVNRMLERTGKDVGSSRKLYADARVVSYRRPWRPDGSAAARAALKEVEALLDGIAREALGLR